MSSEPGGGGEGEEVRRRMPAGFTLFMSQQFVCFIQKAVTRHFILSADGGGGRRTRCLIGYWETQPVRYVRGDTGPTHLLCVFAILKKKLVSKYNNISPSIENRDEHQKPIEANYRNIMSPIILNSRRNYKNRNR